MTKNVRRDPFPDAAPYRGNYAHGLHTPSGQRTPHVSAQIGIAPDGTPAPATASAP